MDLKIRICLFLYFFVYKKRETVRLLVQPGG